MTDYKGAGEGPYYVTDEYCNEVGGRRFVIRGPGLNAQTTASLIREELVGSARIRNRAFAEGRKAAEKEIEEKKAVKDALLCGTGFMKDGKRVPPEDVYLSEAEIKLKKVEKDFKELLHLANEASYLNQDSMAWGIKYADWKKARGIA